MSRPRLTEGEALDRLRAQIRYGCGQKDLAVKFGVSAAFMSAVLKGDKQPTNDMLRSVGCRRISVIEIYHEDQPEAASEAKGQGDE